MLAGRTVHVVDAAVWDTDGNEVGRKSYTYQNPMTDKPRAHHEICEWHLDQYPWECTCGLTAPKAPWFDKAVSEFEGRKACMTVKRTTKTYDKKCWDLAVHFLSDNPELDSPVNCNELAGAIQEAIELWLHDRQLIAKAPADWKELPERKP